MCDDDYFDIYNYSNRAEKSAAATRREETAIKEFETARLEMESRDDLRGGYLETIQLLDPSCHLTQACWKSFRKHVQGCEGWSTRRRAATEAERKEHKVKRKSTAYFTEVTYSVPRDKEVKLPDHSRVFQYASCSDSSDDFETPVSKRPRGS